MRILLTALVEAKGGHSAFPLDYLLLKPGRLTDAEFQVMKSHTTIGADTLAAAIAQYPGAEFLRMARDIAVTHRERFNGAGYPQGLKGEKIPLGGRIVALADAYDALTSKRVYKSAFTHDIARSIIVQENGEHFDPVIVDAFLRVEDQFIKIKQAFSEEPGAPAETLRVLPPAAVRTPPSASPQ